MRIIVHDYSGHPFQVQLSRELAFRGHQVLHLYSASFQTPKGGVLPRPDDPPSFNVEGICLGELKRWKIDTARMYTIANWAPWNELRSCPQDNPRSRVHGLAGKFVFLSSGTIGMKHNPALLLDPGEAMRFHTDVANAVVSEGCNADRLREQAPASGLNNIHSLPLQPYELMPEVLSAGSVLVGSSTKAPGNSPFLRRYFLICARGVRCCLRSPRGMRLPEW